MKGVGGGLPSLDKRFEVLSEQQGVNIGDHLIADLGRSTWHRTPWGAWQEFARRCSEDNWHFVELWGFGRRLRRHQNPSGWSGEVKMDNGAVA